MNPEREHREHAGLGSTQTLTVFEAVDIGDGLTVLIPAPIAEDDLKNWQLVKVVSSGEASDLGRR